MDVGHVIALCVMPRSNSCLSRQNVSVVCLAKYKSGLPRCLLRRLFDPLVARNDDSEASFLPIASEALPTILLNFLGGDYVPCHPCQRVLPSGLSFLPTILRGRPTSVGWVSNPPGRGGGIRQDNSPFCRYPLATPVVGAALWTCDGADRERLVGC